MNMFTKNVKPRKRGRPPGSTPQGAASRERLYATAIQLIAARGYAETTLRDIAKEAGVSVGLLYRYFPSKQAVVIALYDELSADYARQAAMMPSGRWVLKNSTKSSSPDFTESAVPGMARQPESDSLVWSISTVSSLALKIATV